MKYPILKRLEGEEYNIVMPSEYDKERDKDKTCSCMMVIKEGITFKQRKREGIDLSGRYIEGEIDFQNEIPIEMLFMYLKHMHVIKNFFKKRCYLLSR